MENQSVRGRRVVLGDGPGNVPIVAHCLTAGSLVFECSVHGGCRLALRHSRLSIDSVLHHGVCCAARDMALSQSL